MPQPRIVVLLAALLVSLTASAGDVVLTTQGFLLDPGDQPVDGHRALTFTFFALPTHVAAETALWGETYDVTIGRGRYQVDIGLPEAGKKTLPSSVFEGATVYLEVAVEGLSLSPRLAVRPVPLASTAMGLACQDCVGASAIAAGAVTRDELAKDAVTTDKLADGAVTDAKIASLDGAKLKAGSIPASALAGGIPSSLLAGGMTSDQIASLDGTKIRAGSLPTSALSGTIPSSLLAGGIPVSKIDGLSGLQQTCPTGQTLAGYDATLAPVCVVGTPAILQWKSAKLEFGSVNDTAVTRTATLANVGGGVASDLELVAPTGFSASGTCGPTLAAGATCTAQFTLVASGAPGPRTGEGSVYSSAGGSASLHLTGTYAPPLDGATALRANVSCKAIKAAATGSTSNTYWLDPDGSGGNPAFQAYCEMSADNGGWTLVAKVDGADGNNRLLWDAWTASPTLGSTSDFSLSATGDVLYQSYATVKGSEILFFDGGTRCGTDNRLLQTNALLGTKSLSQYLSDLAPVDLGSTSAANFSVPAYRNTGCTQPFNPSSSTSYFPGNAFAINVTQGGNKLRFTVNQNSYDNGIGSNGPADGSYQTGDLDVQGDGVNPWSGHVVSIFVR